MVCVIARQTWTSVVRRLTALLNRADRSIEHIDNVRYNFTRSTLLDAVKWICRVREILVRHEIMNTFSIWFTYAITVPGHKFILTLSALPDINDGPYPPTGVLHGKYLRVIKPSAPPNPNVLASIGTGSFAMKGSVKRHPHPYVYCRAASKEHIFATTALSW